MRIGRIAGAVLTSWFFGLGGGLASLGEMRYALAWLSCLPVASLLAAFISPWALLLLPIALLGSVAHAITVAHRSDAPFRVLHWMPWAMFASTVMTAMFVRAFVVEAAFKAPSSSMYPTLHIGDHLVVDKLSKLVRGWKRGDVIVFVYPCGTDRDYVKRVIGLPGDTVEVRCGHLYVNGKIVPASQVPGECKYDDYDDFSDRWFPRECTRYHEELDGASWDVFEFPDYKPDAVDARDFPMRDHPFPPSCADANGGYGGRRTVAEVVGKVVETKPEGAPACEPQLHYVVPDDHLFVLGDNRNNSNDSRIWGAVPVSNVKGRVKGIWWSSHESGRIGGVH